MLETEIDKKTERWAGQELAKIWGIEVYEMPQFYRIDWQLMKGDETIGFAEFKSRKYTYAQLEDYGGYKLDLKKYVYIHNLTESTGLPVYLVIRCSADGLYAYKHQKDNFLEIKHFPITRFFKSYRNIKNDAQPAVMIPMNLFKPVNGRHE